MNYATREVQIEWQRYWYLPCVAAFGYSMSVLHIYSLGPFIEPLQHAFGWTRAQVSLGITIANVGSALLCIPVGILVDRLGPRRIGLIGVLLIAIAYSSLGTATGHILNWVLLWSFVAVSVPWAQSTVWTSAVASRFERSRGIAFAVALSGAPIGATLFPVLSAWLIENYGWRTAFRATAILWTTIVLPIIFLRFRGAADQPQESIDVATIKPNRAEIGISLAEGFRSPALYKLLFAGAMFAFTMIGILVHFVPILMEYGSSRLAAAGIASIIGISSFVGRLGTGFLLDRFSSERVGAVIFLIANIACVLLLTQGDRISNQIVAAIIIGFTLGAEVDVMAYLSSRYFGLRNFGALFGVVVAALTLGAAFGPLAAGATFDYHQSYTPFLVLTMVLVTVSGLALLTLGRPK
ncbi:MFS transporter [Kineobactrum salinum]|uniref:MFS transporter n=1 Tax=Kineobactrum salinum TaxID=2708301 RepID=A0A6C0U6U8_9GAMM|nr:MFS transporter [Kineobactrum salinum]QIB67736.1 MFS transporter [Kineobactrum salinum]